MKEFASAPLKQKHTKTSLQAVTVLCHMTQTEPAQVLCQRSKVDSKSAYRLNPLCIMHESTPTLIYFYGTFLSRVVKCNGFTAEKWVFFDAMRKAGVNVGPCGRSMREFEDRPPNLPLLLCPQIAAVQLGAHSCIHVTHTLPPNLLSHSHTHPSYNSVCSSLILFLPPRCPFWRYYTHFSYVQSSFSHLSLSAALSCVTHKHLHVRTASSFPNVTLSFILYSLSVLFNTQMHVSHVSLHFFCLV